MSADELCWHPLIVHGAIMVEPTETEPKEHLDQFVAAMQRIAREATERPQALTDAPGKAKVKRLDEVAAARKPCLIG